MKVAVLTLTRDRLEYTQHCFARLQALAGCDFDHFVLDQGSTDGTLEWLKSVYRPPFLRSVKENIGIHRGLNILLDNAIRHGYDVVVKIDNDCELLAPDTLRDVAWLALDGRALLSPRIEGLRSPPAPIAEFEIAGETILETGAIGGIFLAAPALLYDEMGYRFSDGGPVWGTDDSSLCAWWRAQGRRVGYVARLAANHYETTDGQHARFPQYFERRVAEGGPA